MCVKKKPARYRIDIILRYERKYPIGAIHSMRPIPETWNDDDLVKPYERTYRVHNHPALRINRRVLPGLLLRDKELVPIYIKIMQGKELDDNDEIDKILNLKFPYNKGWRESNAITDFDYFESPTKRVINKHFFMERTYAKDVCF